MNRKKFIIFFFLFVINTPLKTMDSKENVLTKETKRKDCLEKLKKKQKFLFFTRETRRKVKTFNHAKNIPELDNELIKITKWICTKIDQDITAKYLKKNIVRTILMKHYNEAISNRFNKFYHQYLVLWNKFALTNTNIKKLEKNKDINPKEKLKIFLSINKQNNQLSKRKKKLFESYNDIVRDKNLNKESLTYYKKLEKIEYESERNYYRVISTLKKTSSNEDQNSSFNNTVVDSKKKLNSPSSKKIR